MLDAHPAPALQVRLLTLRYSSGLGAFDARPLEELLAGVELLAIREHFFVAHEVPHLVCVVSFRVPREVPRVGAPPRARSGESAPREGAPAAGGATPVLEGEERALFESLRAWRSKRARRDGVPPYVIFHNAELTAIVRARPQSLNELGHVEGVGAAKIERYGREILALFPLAASAAETSPAVAPNVESAPSAASEASA